MGIVSRHSPESQCFFVGSPKHETASKGPGGRDNLGRGFTCPGASVATARTIRADAAALFSALAKLHLDAPN
jgi:hypothetical protein